MTLMSWIHDKLHGPSHTEKVADEALRVTEDFTTKVRSLREQIRPYSYADDPFAAMTAAHDSAIEYQDQLDNEFAARPIMEPPRD